MNNTSYFFRSISGFILAACSLLLFSPLITWAFYYNEVAATPATLTVPPPQTAQPYWLPTDDSAWEATAAPEYDRFTLSERRQRQLPTNIPPQVLYSADRTVYLTFDDGPDITNTPQVLDILKQHGIHATFFLVGTEVEKYPALVKRIYDEGHAIGNHSYNHVYRELYQSPQTYVAQLQQTDEQLYKILGCRPRISRAPGGTVGSFTKLYWDQLKKDGYIEVGWNVSSGDASNANADSIYQNIVRQLNNKSLWTHAIILMHDGRGHKETVKALPNIITFLRDQGFTFRVVNSTTPPAW